MGRSYIIDRVISMISFMLMKLLFFIINSIWNVEWGLGFRSIYVSMVVVFFYLNFLFENL